MAAVIGKSLMWIALILVLVFIGSILWSGCASGAWDRIHGGHDQRLVGKWKGELRPNYRVTLNREEKIPFEVLTFELKPDGSFQIMDGQHYKGATYDWGTHDDEVQFKYLAVDYWPTPKFRFRISPDGETVELTSGNSGRIPGVWHRVK